MKNESAVGNDSSQVILIMRNLLILRLAVLFTFKTIDICNTSSPDIMLYRKLIYISMTFSTMETQNYVSDAVCR